MMNHTANNTKKAPLLKRFLMMLAGILFIGICVAAYRLSAFGVDAFTCMNLGISGFLGMSFGTWQLMMNAVILIFVFFQAHQCIGPGTIVNMVCVGYLADFLYWLVPDVLIVSMTLPFGSVPWSSAACSQDWVSPFICPQKRALPLMTALLSSLKN